MISHCATNRENMSRAKKPIMKEETWNNLMKVVTTVVILSTPWFIWVTSSIYNTPNDVKDWVRSNTTSKETYEDVKEIRLIVQKMETDIAILKLRVQP